MVSGNCWLKGSELPSRAVLRSLSASLAANRSMSLAAFQDRADTQHTPGMVVLNAILLAGMPRPGQDSWRHSTLPA